MSAVTLKTSFDQYAIHFKIIGLNPQSSERKIAALFECIKTRIGAYSGGVEVAESTFTYDFSLARSRLPYLTREEEAKSAKEILSMLLKSHLQLPLYDLDQIQS